MLSPTTRRYLSLAHRWAALALSPIFLAILISGAVLAFKPILGEAPPPQASLPTASVVATLRQLDPAGKASSVSVDHAQGVLTLASRGPGPAGSFDAATGAARPEAQRTDVFAVALDLHRKLLVGAGFLVEAATWAMAGIVLVGLFLGLPRLANTLMGWHMGLGWFALPLVALLPLTGVLMILHVGGAELPRPEAGPPLSLARALDAADRAGLPPVLNARAFRGGSVLLTTTQGEGAPRYLVSPSSRIDPITGGPGWVRELHEGTWGGPVSGILNLAGALALGGLTLTGLWSWARRARQARRRSGDADADLLVAYASQTGNAARLAEATATALRGSGARVACASLSALRPSDLGHYRDTLLIASTTGAGALPESAQRFVQALGRSALAGANFSLLALGDRRYAQFCGGAQRLREALLARGATESSPWERVDGNPDHPWRDWAARQVRRLGLKAGELTALGGDQPLTLTLSARERLDDPELGDSRETWSLRFTPEQALRFRPGDLLLLTPHPDAPPRCYSIGSSALAGDATLDLTVGLHRWQDSEGQSHLGLASNWLCHELPLGTRVDAVLRPHPLFNPPTDPARPIVLIAAGAGIAPFPGFLAERAGATGSGPAWLFFGNRAEAADFLYAPRWRLWQRAGKLRLDTAFSRDPGGAYVDARMREHGAELLRWMRDKDAVLYTCGRAGTVGKSVEDALCDILRQHAADPAPEATLARWKAEGRVRLDLFG